MKHLYITILSLISLQAISQPVLTNAMNPTVGHTTTQLNADTTGITPGNAGANVTWNFTLSTSTSNSQTMVSPSSTPYASSFPTATAAYGQGGTYVYYRASSSMSELIGLANSTFTMVYSDPQKMITYPSNYGNSFTDNLSSNYTISGFPATRTGTVTYTYDGYGTLNLNGVTYSNVARIKYTQDITDNIGGGMSTTNLVSTSYAWYANGAAKDPLLTIVTQTVDANGMISSTKTVLRLDPSTSIEKTSPVTALNIYPNPSSGTEISVSFEAKKPGAVTLELTNSIGQVVSQEEIKASTSGLNTTNLNVSSLSNGVYFCRFIDQDGNASGAQKIILN